MMMVVAKVALEEMDQPRAIVEAAAAATVVAAVEPAAVAIVVLVERRFSVVVSVAAAFEPKDRTFAVGPKQRKAAHKTHSHSKSNEAD